MSLYLAVIGGHYDDWLLWPYSRKYQVSAIRNDGQIGVIQTIDPATEGPDSTWKRPTRDTISRLGWPQFVELSKLPEYVANDKIYIIVSKVD